MLYAQLEYAHIILQHSNYIYRHLCFAYVMLVYRMVVDMSAKFQLVQEEKAVEVGQSFA